MSDTNRVSLRCIEETIAGTTPSNPQLSEVKFTGTSDFGFTPETVTSEIIRSDRQEQDLILVNGSVGGQFDTELLAGAFDADDSDVAGPGQSLLTSVLFADNDWTPSGSVAAGVAVTPSDLSAGFTGFNLDTGTWGTTPPAGRIIKVEGTDSNGDALTVFARVTSSTTNTLAVEGDHDFPDSVSQTMTITVGSYIENGKTQISYTFEKAYLDHSPISYEYVRGCVPGTFSMTASASSLVNAAFGFTGRTHEATTTRITGATEASPTVGTTYNASSNVAVISEGGIPGQSIVTEMSIEIDNNLRELNTIGTLGASDVGAGTFMVTGSLQTYFEDISLLQKLINNTETSLMIGFEDSDGSVLIFDMPAVKFSEGVPDVAGRSQDVMLNLSFQAYAGTPTGSLDEYTLRVIKF